jgi:hypothetical protein
MNHPWRASAAQPSDDAASEQFARMLTSLSRNRGPLLLDTAEDDVAQRSALHERALDGIPRQFESKRRHR